MRRWLVVASVVVCLGLASSAAAGAALRVSFLGEAASVSAGSSWGYYLRAWENGKPWTGEVSIAVTTLKGTVVDHVGLFLFPGSRLGSYIWNSKDKGRRFRFVVTFLQFGKPVGTAAYVVHVT